MDPKLLTHDENGLPFCNKACVVCELQAEAEEAARLARWEALTPAEVQALEDERDRLEHLGEARAEEAAAMHSLGFYWGGGDREDRF